MAIVVFRTSLSEFNGHYIPIQTAPSTSSYTLLLSRRLELAVTARKYDPPFGPSRFWQWPHTGKLASFSHGASFSLKKIQPICNYHFATQHLSCQTAFAYDMQITGTGTSPEVEVRGQRSMIDSYICSLYAVSRRLRIASVDEEGANQGTKGTFIGAVRTSSPALSSSATLDGVNLPTALVAAAPTSSLRYFRTTLPSRIASPEMSDIYCNWNGAIIPTIDPNPTIPGKRFIRRNFKSNPKLSTLR